MATAATSLLGLALPVQGELSGTWGDTVNNSITNLLDAAVAGTTTLSADADVTLTNTPLAANQARQAIILCSGARTVLRTITAPSPKTYVVINATTGGFGVKLVGVGPTTGVTIPASSSRVVAWNGTDFVATGADVSAISGLGTGVATFLVTPSSANLAAAVTGETGSGALVFADSPTLVTSTSRINPRVLSAASSASITPDLASYDQYVLTAQAATLTINAPIGTPLDGNKLIIRVKDDGTARTLTWNATYTAVGVILPTTTVANKTVYVGCIYNTAATRWDVLAVSQEL